VHVPNSASAGETGAVVMVGASSIAERSGCILLKM
jgi:hypothetical protein